MQFVQPHIQSFSWNVAGERSMQWRLGLGWETRAGQSPGTETTRTATAAWDEEDGKATGSGSPQDFSPGAGRRQKAAGGLWSRVIPLPVEHPEEAAALQQKEVFTQVPTRSHQGTGGSDKTQCVTKRE